MKYFLDAAKLLLLDLASTLLFLILYLATKNLAVSVATAMALGLAQIGWQFLRKKPIDTMQWLSLFLVLGAGGATLITNDPHFVMLKPTVIYTVVGIVMGELPDGGRVEAVVTGDRDPGYGSTSKMIAESALCLVRDVQGEGGVWTPGALMGLALRKRLKERAGLTFSAR